MGSSPIAVANLRNGMSNPLRKYPELFTDTVFFIGNGGSRKDFDLNILLKRGTIIGCNALYRDFQPDILICQDAKMARELHNAKYTGLVLTGKGIGINPPLSVQWRMGDARTSGVFGLNLINKILKPNKCYVLGIDAYAGNIYIGTHNYTARPIRYRKIIPQYIAATKGKTEFINVNPRDTWEADRFISYREFYKELAV